MQAIFSLIAGLIFGLGLVISGMANPTKVQDFLDFTGNWDPSLAFVMGGAIAVTLPGFLLVRRKGAPVFGGKLHLPTRSDIDGRLLGGAALFGIGWGLGGFCPGPAVTALSSGLGPVLTFVIAMLAGMWAAKLTLSALQRRTQTA